MENITGILCILLLSFWILLTAFWIVRSIIDAVEEHKREMQNGKPE